MDVFSREKRSEIMRKLEKARKTVIAQKEVGKRKPFVYKLKEGK